MPRHTRRARAVEVVAERSPLVIRLAELQEQAAETNHIFAARLGISEAYWARLRRGQRVGSRRFLIAVVQRFPELTSLIAELVA